MLRGLTAFSEIEIIGIENPIEFTNRVYKGICAPPIVLIFKYKCPNSKEVNKVPQFSVKLRYILSQHIRNY